MTQTTNFKKVISILTLVLMPFHLLLAETQSLSSACKTPLEKDLTMLDKVQSSYKEISSIKAQFHQTSFLSALDQSDESGGEVLFEKPGKMRWNYTYPTEQFFLVNDEDPRFKKGEQKDAKVESPELHKKTVWFYQKEANQVIVDSISDIVISEAPVAFLMGIGNISEVFELISSCKTEDGGFLLELKEKKLNDSDSSNKEKKRSKLNKFKLLIDSSYIPTGAEVYDIGGNITSILMDKLQKNVKIDPQVFKPNFPKGVDIVTR